MPVQVKEFEAVGVDHVWAVAIGDPEKVDNWARKCNLAEGRVRPADLLSPAARKAGLQPADKQNCTQQVPIEARTQIRAVADRSGAFARLLGLEMNKPDKPGPHCQR